MRSYQRLTRLAQRLQQPLRRIASSRRGTVIVIVLALLGILAFMGFFVLGITSQENQSATYFANSPTAKVLTPNLNADAFFNDILRQIIIGPAANEQQSALWGGNKSLLPTMFGRDMATFNGQGVNLIWNGTTNAPAVDQNYNNLAEDGTTDGAIDNSALMQLNLSPAAQNTVVNLNTFAGGVPYPEPDVSITYPDNNNAFLAYDALVPNGLNSPVRVVIPSYHRPQILRSLATSLGLTTQQWYTAPGTAKYVLHPHVEHLAIDNSGTISATQRFLTLVHPPTTGADGQPGVAGVDDNGDTIVDNNLELGWPGSDDVPNIGLFPIAGDAGPAVQEGIWTNIVPPGDPIQYGIDVDNTGDGVADSFYMDFGFPLMTDPSGNQFVALAAVKIIDADALLNLNAHGNRSGSVVLGGATPPTPFGGTSTFISTSDHGVSASEVNPEWALNARPLSGFPDFPGTPAALQAALQQAYLFFRSPSQGGLPVIGDDHSAGSFELANIEWWNAINGRPQLSPGANPATDPPTVSGSSFPGRWGENTSRLDPAVLNVINFSAPIGAGAQAGFGSYESVGSGDPFPLPGTSGVDDNFNSPDGGTYVDAQGIAHLGSVQPIDQYASGTFVTGVQGKVRGLIQQGLQMFPAYSQFYINPSIPWATAFTATASPGPLTWTIGAAYPQIPLTPLTSPVMPNSGSALAVDEADEQVTEPSLAANRPNDNIFAPSENSIQLGNADFTALGTPARTASLMPFNFSASARAAQIRQRFTSTSWDLKSFGKEFLGPYAAVNDARRLWEFTDLSGTGNGPFLFPPVQAGYLGPDNKPGIANTDDNGDGTPDDVGELGWPGSDDNLGPFRNDVACLLRVVADPNFQVANPKLLAQRLMSINGLTEQLLLTNASTGTNYPNFRFRPLTPHPLVGLTSTPITPPSPTSSISRPEQLTPGDVATQEWLARYDRQRMARDIYTLLYLFGGGADTAGVAALNYTQDNSGRTLYTEDQLQEMAQFAVNVVDQMDPDDTITVFEYDKNLADGWNLDDNAFDGTADSAAPFSIPVNDRGVVYGVERQTLALNEALIAFSQVCVNTTGNLPQNHPDTQWDDQKQWSFLYLELENVGPFPVNFQNEQWQIAIKQSPIVAAPSVNYGSESRLIFQSSQPPVQPGPSAKMTIGGMAGSTNGISDWITSGTGQNSGTTVNFSIAPAVYPSYMVIDPNDTTGTPTNSGSDYQFPIAPRAAFVSPSSPPFGVTTALNLDLSQPAQSSQYWVVPPSTTLPSADGTPVPNAPFSAGTQMLQFVDPIPAPPAVPGITLTTPIILRIELKRRVDLNRAAIIPSAASNDAAAADNPWIVVDHMDVPVSKLVLKITGSPNDYALQIDAQLTDTTSPGLVSTERSEPLYHDFQLNPFNPTTSNPAMPNGPYIVASSTPYPRNGGASTRVTPLFQANSLGMDNDAADNDSNPATVIPPHPRYQPHYDRDFTSVVELFNVPLWGPYGPATPGATGGPIGSPPSPPAPIPTQLGNNALRLSSGLTHLLASRITETGAPLVSGPANPTPELLTGADYVPTDPSLIGATGHYVGHGTAGFRLQHPEGSDQTVYNPQGALPTGDPTENRWFRLLGLVEVPTRSHRGLEAAPFQPYQVNAGSIGGPLGFYRTPGKINVNTLRHPDVLAALIGEPDIFTMNYLPSWIPNNSYVVGNFVVPIHSVGQTFLCTTAGTTGGAEPGWPASIGATVADGSVVWTAVGSPGQSVPYLLPSVDPTDTVLVAPPQVPTYAGPSPVRDWWEQMIATRDGFDPITGLSIPGIPRSPQPQTWIAATTYSGVAVAVPTVPNGFVYLCTQAGVSGPTEPTWPTTVGQTVTDGTAAWITAGPVPSGSHPFRNSAFSAFGNVDMYGYNGKLESTPLRSLSGDAVTPPLSTAAPANFDQRRRLFELGTAAEHGASAVDYATKQRLLSRLIGNTTTRSNVFFVWMQVDFFAAKDVSGTTPPSGLVRIGAKLGTSGVPGTSPGYRGFFVIDRSQALPLMSSQYLPSNTAPSVFSLNQSFNYQSLILYRQRIQ